MAKRTDGEIILGLNITDTTAEIQSGLNKVLQNTKVQHLVLKTAIDRDETEKAVTKLANDLSNKAIKLGIDVEVNAKDVKSVLAEQQKIASTQAELNRQMEKYRGIAKELGITLNKTTWNEFNHSIATADFSKAKDIIKSAKQQIDDYNRAVKSMNSDTSVSGDVASIVNKFSQLKDVSTETNKRVNLLKANLSQFEQADSTKAKLSAYRRLQTLLTQLDLEYQQLSISEKNLANANSIQDKVKDAQSLYTSLSKVYSTADGQAGEALKSSLAELSTTLDTFEKNSQGLSGGKLAAEWDKVDTAVRNVTRAVKEYKAEQSSVGKVDNTLDSTIKGINNAIESVSKSGATGTGVDVLKTELHKLSTEAQNLKTNLASLDVKDGVKVQEFSKDVEDLKNKFQSLSKEIKVFGNAGEFAQFESNVEKARQKVAQYAETYSAIKARPDLVKDLKTLQNQANNISSPEQLKKFNAEFAKFDTQVVKAGLHTKSLADQFKKAFMNFAQFFSASHFIYQSVETVKDMIGNVREFDGAMIELRKVTDETDDAYDRFLTRTSKKAVELGTTITDLVNATADFSRLGFTMDEAEELGRIATVYANVGDDISSIDDATNILITSMKAFGLEAEDAMSIVDRLNSIGNKYAISSGALGEGLTKAASYLATAGNTIDQTVAMITAMTEITQDATESGNAVKVLAMRLRGAKTDIVNAGESADGMAESTSRLREQILALTNVDGNGGFDIMLSDDEFRSTYDIMKGIASVWKDMSNVNQAALIELIAGKQRGNSITALLTSMAQAENVLNTSLESSGSAMEEYSRYLEGVEAKTNQFKASFEALSTTIVNSDFLKDIIDGGTSFIQFIDDSIQKLGGFGNALMNIVSILALLNAAKLPGLFTQIVSSIGKFTRISKIVESFKTASAAGLTFNGTLKNLGAQLAATATPAGIASAAISGVMVVLTAAIAIYQNYKQKLEEQRQAAVDSAKTYDEAVKSLDGYKLKIEELRGAIDSGNLSEQDAYNKRKELLAIQEELIKKFGLEAEGLNLVTGAINAQKNAIDALSSASYEDWLSRNYEAVNRAKTMMTDFKQSRLADNILVSPDFDVSTAFEEGSDSFAKEFVNKVKAELTNVTFIDDGNIDSLDFTVDSGSIYDALEAYEKIFSIAKELGESHFGDNFDQYIGKALSDYSLRINLITEAISKNEELLNTYVEGQLVSKTKEYSSIWSSILAAQVEYEDALLRGDDVAAESAVAKMENAKQAFLAAGWSDDAVNLYVERFIEEFERVSAQHQLNLNFKIAYNRNEQNVQQALQQAVKTFENESGTVDLYSILNIGTKIEGGGISDIAPEEQAAYTKLTEVAERYGYTVETLIQYLAQLGYIKLQTAQSSDSLANSQSKTIESFENTISALEQALHEYKTTGSVSAATYKKVISYGEDYADLFDFTTGKITLQNDELGGLVDTLVQQTGATLASNGATEDEIRSLAVLSASLRRAATASDNTMESIGGLVDILGDTKEGTEYSTLAMLDLIEEYPELASHIIETANGYKIEKNAVEDLISEKAKLLKMNEALLRQNARDYLISGAATDKTADTVDQIFEEYYSQTGKQIGSFDEYVTAWESHFQTSATDNWVDGYIEYVEATIAELNKSDSIDKLMEDLLDPKKLKLGKSGGKDDETQFEKDYKKHQHYLNMNQESVSDYLSWLDSAYKSAYASGQIKLDDYYKYQEEVYQKTQELFQDSLADTEHQIELLSKQDGNTDKIISLYRGMQEDVHAQAEHYRSLGIAKNSDLIQELQKQWWSYEESIRNMEVSRYEDQISANENLISQNQRLLDSAVSIGDYSAVQNYTDKMVAYYKDMQETIHAQAEYYRSLGYNDTSDEINKLKDLWMDCQDSIVETASAGFQALLDNANNSLDELQDVYTTLTDAAQEYADSGFITVDTMQDILSMGTKYLAHLTDENGQLVINEENIRKVIAARTDQVAVETALNYVEKLRTALNNNDVASLENLLNATDAVTGSTWDLVYAQLAALNLSGDQYDTALQRINAIRSLADTAITSIGHATGQIAEQANEAAEAAKKALQETSDALKDILDYTMDMIKQEVDDQIDALNDQIDKYQEIVDLKKAALELTKEQDEYDKNVSSKVGDISKLQSRIQQLSLDDSREAQAERLALEEELSELQGELADYQADKAYDVTVDTLDKQAEAFEKSKQKEIDILEDSISSYEKLYSKSIERIESAGEGLLSQLLAYNTEYGNDLGSTIETAWNNASTALQEYGGYLEAVKATQDALNLATSSKSNWSVGGSVSDGFTFSETQEKPLTLGGSKDYSTGADNGKKAADLVREMKQNSAEWLVSSEDRQNELAADNERKAKQIEELLGIKLIRGDDGAWYINNIGGALLYDKYHQGGIVGDKGTLKDNEAFSVLENGEMVLESGQKSSLYKIIDMAKEYGDMLSKFSTAVFGDGTLNNAVSKVKDIVSNGNSQARDRIDSKDGNRSVSVDASITIHGDVDKDTWTKIHPLLKQHQTEIADIVNRQTYDAFSRRGIKV